MVTDHFFNSNTSHDRRRNWSEWVKNFCSGYEDARNAGEKHGLDVFFGWEETFNSDDYLIYGLDKAWLLGHPEMVRWTREEQFREIRRYGGCVVQAHPFRQHSYIGTMQLSPHFVDAIEAANAGNHEAIYDAQAFEYARILDLPAVAGSDIHNVKVLGKNGMPFGICLATKLSSINDYVFRILNKQQIALHIPPGRCDFHSCDGSKPLTLNAEIRDGNGKTTGRFRMTFNDVADRLQRLSKKSGAA
jgi:hypothetical protein